jgi:hypothetical protein
LAPATAVAEVGPGAEGFALTAQQDGAAGGILVQRLQRVGELADQVEVEEVVRGALDLDGGDVIADG